MIISIIIPYHRGEAYLRDCLDSLKEQAGQSMDRNMSMEILLICDHVAQMELRCLAEYEELPITVYHLQDSTGVAAARNLGLDRAKGDYIYFLDSDDYLCSSTMSNLMSTVQEKNSDIIYGKKIDTWYGRGLYLTNKMAQEKDHVDEEQHSNSAERSELLAKTKHNSHNTFLKNQISTDTRHTSSDEEETNTKISERNQVYEILVTDQKGVRNLSVLGILFKRCFIEQFRLRFPEDLIYFSDTPFLMEALSKAESFAECLSAEYMKRKHNDAINFPALSQRKDPKRFYEFVDTYYETVQRIDENTLLKAYFDRKYITYYTSVFAPKLKRSNNSAWREENFIAMSDIINQANSEELRTLKGYQKRLLRSLKNKKLKASVRTVTVHLAHDKLKKILHSKKDLTIFLYQHFFLKRSVKENWIILESFFGKNYSDNPKYIYEYLSKNYPGKYKFIWVIDNKHTKIPFQHKEIKRYHMLYSYYLARSKYIIFNCRQPEWVVKRPENVFLQTWHGTPLKKLVFDQEEIASASPQYKKQMYKQSRAWDYLIAPNTFSSQTFRRCFLYEKRILETGYPRNDILYAPDKDEIARNVRVKLGIPGEKKVILYAPTWRDDVFYGKGQYKFELQLDIELMRQRLTKEYVILLRTHYFIADQIDLSAFQGFAYDVSRYDDISELYLISDILITDYSSVFFDYANLKRPMLFFTYDLENYRDVLRGFYIDIEKEVPGPLLYTTEEVIDAVFHIDLIHRDYKQRYEEFYRRFCEWEDGHAAEKVVESVFVDV